MFLFSAKIANALSNTAIGSFGIAVFGRPLRFSVADFSHGLNFYFAQQLHVPDPVSPEKVDLSSAGVQGVSGKSVR